MTLYDLNSAEEELSTSVRSMEGLIEDKLAQLGQADVFGKYAQVFEGYVNLIDDEADGLEALKRAIFLLWFEDAEPTFLTGIANLPESTRAMAFDKLEAFVESDKIDSELTWMLQHYYAISDWVFNLRHKASPTLTKLLTDNQERWINEAEEGDFLNRGRMGRYWSSLASSNAKRRSFEERKSQPRP